METKVKVGIIGTGDIFGTYVRGCRAFDILEVAACADIDHGKAQAAAAEFAITRACSTKEVLADPEIEIVLNLTVPAAHAEIAYAALEAGKNVYNEKPLAPTTEDGRRILDLARKKGLLVGCAPDTFLGGSIQTCRKLIDDGRIGEPVAATAFMMCHGHETWHPAPEFHYKPGGGPMLDMGPYYITTLVNLLGPVKRVCGSARITFPERTITSEPMRGTIIKVETPTHIAGVMDFENGAIGIIITSFDIWAHTLPCLEVHGTEGSISVPDPNCFSGSVRLRLRGAAEWEEVPLTHPYTEQWRGIGVADMAYALRSGRPHRANGEMAYHVLDIMCACIAAGETEKYISLTSTCERPAPLPLGLREGVLDE